MTTSHRLPGLLLSAKLTAAPVGQQQQRLVPTTHLSEHLLGLLLSAKLPPALVEQLLRLLHTLSCAPTKGSHLQ
jgi:hypothetical protein